ncbi:MAG: peptidoglycan-binding protein [Pedobacter sp.]|nr:peptidoglycan-binding protein [Pedobacter sp.]
MAQSQLGVRELTGRNDGLAVEAYLRYTGLGKGNPWCAAFVSWVYAQGGFARPRTAWSPALFPQNRCVKQIGKGLVYGLYDGHKGRIAHCGIATNGDGDWVVGIEGNTNLAGSAEGDGVYLKRRHRKTIYAIADWLSEKGGKDAD